MIAADEMPATRLDRTLAGANPWEIVAQARRIIEPGRLAVVSSFGTESAALLKVVADVDPTIPTLFVDTGWLFEETIAYRDQLAAALKLQDVRVITASPQMLDSRDPGSDLWFTEPEACCQLRKVEPLMRALATFDGWINGRKRYHGGERAHLPIVEADGHRIKFNPLARTTAADVERIIAEAGLPRHPLLRRGFASVGCMPCTSRTRPGEAVRAGRWRDRDQTECGIHSALCRPVVS